MPDDGPDEEPVVAHLPAPGNLDTIDNGCNGMRFLNRNRNMTSKWETGQEREEYFKIVPTGTV